MGTQSRSDTVSRRVATAVVPEAEVAKTAPAVHAAPVDRTVRPEQDNALLRLAEGLTLASPSFKKYADKLQGESDKRQILEATEAAKQANAASASEAMGVLDKTQDAVWQRAFMLQSMKKVANDRRREILTKYNNEFDKDTGDLNAFVQQEIAGDLKGLDDPDLQIAYLESMEEFETELRKDHTKYTQDKLKQESFDLMSTGLYDFFDVTNGEFTVDEMEDVIKSFQAQGHEITDINDVMVKQAILYADAKSNSKVLDNFFQKGVNGVASFGFTEQYGEMLLNAKQAIDTKQKTEALKVDKEAAFLIMQEKRSLIDDGNRFTDRDFVSLMRTENNPTGALTPEMVNSLAAYQSKKEAEVQAHADTTYELIVEDGIDKGLFTEQDIFTDEGLDAPAKARLIHKMRTGNEKKQALALIDSAFDLGTPEVLLNDATKSELTDGYNRWLERESRNHDMETPEGKNAFMTRAVDVGVKVGNIMPNSMVQMFRTADPSDQQRFEQAVFQYNTLKRYNKTYLNANVSDTDAAQFERYNMLVSSAGMDGQAALKIMESTDKMSLQDAKGVTSSLDAREQIRSAVDGLDSVNPEYSYGEIKRLTEEGLQQQMPLASAVEWATERYEATNVLVNGRYLKVPADQRIPELGDILDWTVQQSMHLIPEDEVGDVRVMWQPITKRWAVWNDGLPVFDETGMPVEINDIKKLRDGAYLDDKIAEYRSEHIPGMHPGSTPEERVAAAKAARLQLKKRQEEEKRRKQYRDNL